MQQTKFRGRDVCELAAHRERHGITMQLKIRSGNACSERLLKSTQNRPHPCCKFPSAKWLGDVSVGPKIQTANPVFLACPRREENNGDGGEVGALANFPADFKTA